MSAANTPLPSWVTFLLMPLLNLVTALVISGFVIWMIGQSPFEALGILINGALGDVEVEEALEGYDHPHIGAKLA